MREICKWNPDLEIEKRITFNEKLLNNCPESRREKLRAALDIEEQYKIDLENIYQRLLVERMWVPIKKI